MLRKTHIPIGVTSGFACGIISVNNPLDITTFIIYIVIILSSTLPDIDSDLNNVIKIKHRGFTHSILFGIILSAFIYFIYPIILPAFLLGFYLHLAADMLTNTGVQLFYPLKKKIGLHVMDYDSYAEVFIQYSCYLIIVILFWKQVPIDIKSFILNML